MVGRALETRVNARWTADGTLEYALEIKNAGAGHHLPAYPTPEISVQLWIANEQGAHIRPVASDRLGWRLTEDLERELEDTRIPAGASRWLRGRLRPEPGDPAHSALQLSVSIVVHPKAHYSRVFRSQATRTDLPQRTRAFLQLAIEEVENSPYPLPARLYRPAPQ